MDHRLVVAGNRNTVKDSRADARRVTVLSAWKYKVQLTYFRPPGKFLAIAEALTSREAITDVWTDVNDMRRLGQLPGLRSRRRP